MDIDAGPAANARRSAQHGAGSGQWRLADVALRLLTAAGLAIDAYVHAHLAGDFDAIGRTLSQGVLFRVEAGVASLLVLLVLFAPWRRAVYAAVLVVAASALGAVLLYRYVNVGALGPLPNMYEPIWYFQKSLSAVGEAVALAGGLAGFAVALRARGRVR